MLGNVVLTWHCTIYLNGCRITGSHNALDTEEKRQHYFLHKNADTGGLLWRGKQEVQTKCWGLCSKPEQSYRELESCCTLWVTEPRDWATARLLCAENWSCSDPSLGVCAHTWDQRTETQILFLLYRNPKLERPLSWKPTVRESQRGIISEDRDLWNGWQWSAWDHALYWPRVVTRTMLPKLLSHTGNALETALT